MECTPALLAAMPKIELHVHMESTMSGRFLARCAEAQGRQLPRPEEELYHCSAQDLSDFLAFLDSICAFVGTTAQLEEAAVQFSADCRRDNILYAEAILNPTHWPQFSVPEIISALTAGFDRGQSGGGTDCRFTLSLSRTQTEQEALDLVETMAGYRTHRLAGLSIDGNEALAGRTGQRFQRAFQRAGELGFGRTVHAGESSGPEGVRDALTLLGADRLDHGVRAIEDPALTAELVERQVPLNICLTSNLTLLYGDPAEHPLRRLLDAGAAVTLNRDDPTFLGGLTLSEELGRAAALAHMDLETMLACQRTAAKSAFCAPETRDALLAAIGRFAAENGIIDKCP